MAGVGWGDRIRCGPCSSPIVQLGAMVTRSERPRDHLPLVAGYVAINAAILAMNVRDADPFWYIWVPFAFAGWWWVGRRA